MVKDTDSIWENIRRCVSQLLTIPPPNLHMCMAPDHYNNYYLNISGEIGSYGCL